MPSELCTESYCLSHMFACHHRKHTESAEEWKHKESLRPSVWPASRSLLARVKCPCYAYTSWIFVYSSSYLVIFTVCIYAHIHEMIKSIGERFRPFDNNNLVNLKNNLAVLWRMHVTVIKTIFNSFRLWFYQNVCLQCPLQKLVTAYLEATGKRHNLMVLTQLRFHPPRGLSCLQ